MQCEMHLSMFAIHEHRKRTVSVIWLFPVLTKYATNYIEQSVPRKADCSSARQEIPRILWTTGFITVFVINRRSTASGAQSDQSKGIDSTEAHFY